MRDDCTYLDLDGVVLNLRPASYQRFNLQRKSHDLHFRQSMLTRTNFVHYSQRPCLFQLWKWTSTSVSIKLIDPSRYLCALYTAEVPMHLLPPPLDGGQAVLTLLIYSGLMPCARRLAGSHRWLSAMLARSDLPHLRRLGRLA